MWYSLVGLVSSFMFSPITPGEASFYTNGFLFNPPACEHKVIFPQFPQSIGVLAKDESTYSAQLYLPNTFMRADCKSEQPESHAKKSDWLEMKMTHHIESLGGNSLIILNYSVTDSSAKFSAQLFMENESVLLNGALFLGDDTLLTLTTIERNRVRPHTDTNRFISSALILKNL
ncbi:hypothetical protein [Alkalimarinus sediminis]|uniref:Uncharacterized protein n=1 Tax=Alkalimarinus sediminis TaxID=1632866 RepID=A0A9E8HJJ5_9ALTE|nr:hypothetical protein [Alkalimarinus sediminis]UZW75840.1 hypothetical protein NNL22_04460 [Alkalimarinus sediminis]